MSPLGCCNSNDILIAEMQTYTIHIVAHLDVTTYVLRISNTFTTQKCTVQERSLYIGPLVEQPQH